MRGWEHGPGGFEHFEWLGPLFGVLLVAAIIVGVVLIVRALTLSSRHSHSVAPGHGGGAVVIAPPTRAPAQTAVRQTGALAILEKRFARGEIDREEFHQRRNDLLSQPGALEQPTPPSQTGQAEQTGPTGP